MDKTSSPLIIVILTVLLGVMTFLYFTKETVPQAPPEGRMGQGPFGPESKRTAREEQGKKLLKELNLTAEQEEKIDEFRKKDKETLKAKREAVENTRRKMEAAMDNPATSEEELKTLFNEVEKVRSEMGAARFEHTLTIRNLLTPEQRQKFSSLKPSRSKEDVPSMEAR